MQRTEVEALIRAYVETNYNLRALEVDDLIVHRSLLLTGQAKMAAPFGYVEHINQAGPGSPGETVLLKAGTNYIQMSWDSSTNKWVSTPHWSVGQIGTYTFSGTSYLPAAVSEVGYVLLPGFKALVDAGLIPQVSVVGLLDNSGAGTTYIQANIREFTDGDTGFNEIATGGEISNAGTTGTIRWSDWSTVTLGSITDPNAILTLAHKVSSGTGTVERASVNLRWISN
jgi:hypothetical protein